MIQKNSNVCLRIVEDKLLLRLQQKQALKKPKKRNQNSLYNLIDTSESLLESESGWIRQSDDLVAVALDPEYGWFGDFLASTLTKISRGLTMASLNFLSHAG